MVRREIQPDADRWTESADRLELERADFDSEHVEIEVFERDFAERFADVAAGDGALAARVQHLREQFGRGRLAVRPGDGDDWRVDRAPAQFQFADRLDISRRKICRKGRRGINARTQNDKIERRRIVFRDRASPNRYSAAAEILDGRFKQPAFLSAVEDGHCRAFAPKQ